MSEQAREDKKVAELLEAVIDLSAEDRVDALQDLGAELGLAEYVLKLASAEEESDFVLDQPLLTSTDIDLDELARTAQETSGEGGPEPEDPESIGPFRLQHLLGEGGMGRVYLARQEYPVSRDVALKIMRRGLTRESDRIRFDTERQALARLNHPHIAQMFEAGTTEEGHPWFAMELVQGEPITRYCDRHCLDIDERLRLFADALLAVQHAHQKQLLHRDLKPSNILVTEVDGLPMVKIIDFGIAEGLGDENDEAPGRQRAGTPGYSPPESLSSPDEVIHLDTRSDIYTLGVTLYELLSARRPYDQPGEAPTAVWRRIRSGAPLTPAQQVADLPTEEAVGIAQLRSSRPDRLVRTLSGDLGAIVMKAISHDRDLRYSSCGSFLHDVGNYLGHYPVSARDYEFTDVARLFVRRHAGAVIAGGLLLLALAVGLMAWSQEAQRATTEAQRAQREALQAHEALAESRQLSDFMVELFELTGTRTGQPDRMTTRELLDLGAEHLASRPAMPPLERARLMQLLGEIYMRVYALDPAREMATQALALRRENLPASDTAIADSLGLLGDILRIEMRYEEAEPLLREALSIALNAQPPHPAATAVAWERLASLYWMQDHTDEAIAALERALDIRELDLGGANEPALADALFHLGNMLHSRGRDAEAHPYLAQAVRLYLTLRGDADSQTATALHNLAETEEALGLLEAAEANYSAAIAAWRINHGRHHPRPMMATESLARALGRWGRPGDGAAVAQTAVSDREAAHGPEDPQVAPALIALGVNQALDGQNGAARATLERAHDITVAAFGEGSPRTEASLDALGWLDWREGRVRQAEATHRDLLQSRLERFGEDNTLTAFSYHNLGLALASAGRMDEANEQLSAALRIWESELGPEHRSTAHTQHYLGLVKWHLGEMEQARTLLEQAIATRQRLFPGDHPDVTRSREALAALQSGATPYPVDGAH